MIALVTAIISQAGSLVTMLIEPRPQAVPADSD